MKFNDVKYKRPRELRGPKAKVGSPKGSEDSSGEGVAFAFGDDLVGRRVGHHGDDLTADHPLLNLSWGRKGFDLI